MDDKIAVVRAILSSHRAALTQMYWGEQDRAIPIMENVRHYEGLLEAFDRVLTYFSDDKPIE